MPVRVSYQDTLTRNGDVLVQQAQDAADLPEPLRHQLRLVTCPAWTHEVYRLVVN